MGTQTEHGGDGDTEATKSEGMREHIAARVDSATAKRDFYEFIAAEEFESDAVQFDIADAAHSNLRRRANKEIGDALCEFVRRHRVDAASLSTGFLFSYWPWYKLQRLNDADVKRDAKFARMD